jgi:hypothetical protein
VTTSTTYPRPPQPWICLDGGGGAAAPLETPRRQPPPSLGGRRGMSLVAVKVHLGPCVGFGGLMTNN